MTPEDKKQKNRERVARHRKKFKDYIAELEEAQRKQEIHFIKNLASKSGMTEAPLSYALNEIRELNNDSVLVLDAELESSILKNMNLSAEKLL